jgi:hypothetical protein
LFKQDTAEIAVPRDIIGRAGNGPPERGRSGVRLALTLDGESESVVDLGVIGPDL